MDKFIILLAIGAAVLFLLSRAMERRGKHPWIELDGRVVRKREGYSVVEEPKTQINITREAISSDASRHPEHSGIQMKWFDNIVKAYSESFSINMSIKMHKGQPSAAAYPKFLVMYEDSCQSMHMLQAAEAALQQKLATLKETEQPEGLLVNLETMHTNIRTEYEIAVSQTKELEEQLRGCGARGKRWFVFHRSQTSDVTKTTRF